MEFFTSTPARPINPMMATNDIGLPVSHNIITPPIIPNGITDNTINVLLNVLNSRISTMINKNTVAITTVINPPPKASFSLSASPASCNSYPSGSCNEEACCMNWSVTWLVSTPLPVNAVMTTNRFLSRCLIVVGDDSYSNCMIWLRGTGVPAALLIKMLLNVLTVANFSFGAFTTIG